MAKPRARRPARSTTAVVSEEWIGGRASVPAYIAEGEPFRPELVLWVGGGKIVAMRPVPPERADDEVVAALLHAFEEPLAGRPRRPHRIRVASPALADRLRAVVGSDIQIALAPTPEVDALAQHFFSTLAPIAGADDDERDERSYLERASVTQVAAFFRAAARLHRVAPWDIVPSDSDLLAIDLPSLDVRGLCASIVGQLRESFGVLLFDSIAGFRAFADMADRALAGHGTRGGRVFAIDFLPRHEMPARMLAEIDEHRFPLAAKDACPMILALDADRIPVPLDERDVELATMCSEGLARFFEKHPRWRWSGAAHVEERFEIEAIAGQPQVVITAPYPEPRAGDTQRVKDAQPAKDAPRDEKAPARVASKKQIAATKKPRPTTVAAINRLLEELWGREFMLRHRDELEAAIDEIGMAATYRGERHDVDEVVAACGSLPFVWSCFWRPMADGRTGVEEARRLATLRAPVLAAALDRMAAARAAYAEVLLVEPDTRRLTMRDLFDGTIYRLVVDRNMARKVTRHLRIFGPLVEIDDGSWHFPSVLYAHATLDDLSPEALVAETRDAVAFADGDPESIDPAAPHAGLLRWAGFAIGRIVAHALTAAQKPPPKRYMVTSEGDRFEVHEVTAQLPAARSEVLFHMLAKTADFHSSDPRAYSLVDASLTTVHPVGETVGDVDDRDGALHLQATSEKRLARLLARLGELAGAPLTVVKHEIVRPWETTPGLVAGPEEGAEPVVGAKSAPFDLPASGRGSLARTHHLDHMRRQLDEHVPMLDGVPRALVATPEGRERVEGWLRGAERLGISGDTVAFMDLDPIRAELGLAPIMPGGR